MNFQRFFKLAFFLIMVFLCFSACYVSQNIVEKDVHDGLPNLLVGNPEQGEVIFKQGNDNGRIACKMCHSLDGNKNSGPSLQGITTNAHLRVDGLPSEKYIQQSILEPSIFIVPNFDDEMPKDYSNQFSEEDVDNLVAFILSHSN